jgi:aspartate/glutamate racemase
LNFYYQETPKWGYYCIYKKRSNESEGKIPDCEGVSQTLERHAKMLWNAGVDFIVVDSTNLPFIDDISDVLQVQHF